MRNLQISRGDRRSLKSRRRAATSSRPVRPRLVTRREKNTRIMRDRRSLRRPRLSAEQVAVLLDAARSFNRAPKATVEQRPTKPGPRARNRPGDRFNREATWDEILLPRGWTRVSTVERKTLWRRSGKLHGISATTGFCTSEASGDLLYVFSSNALPFEDGRAYSKFAAFALLNHNGDFRAAAKALQKRKPRTRLLNVSADDMLPTLRAVNANRCDPALPSSEVVNIAKSIGGYRAAFPLSSLNSLNSQEAPELPPAAYHGLAGDILNGIDPYTEAAPAALLAHVLVGFGVRIGCKPHFMVQHDRHVARVMAVLVGRTAKGRKGTSWGSIRYLLDQTQKNWTKEHLVSGLSSGEGLVYRVRDLPMDMGTKDCLVIEPEFATTLTVINREGNTLSGIIRQAWDDGDLSVLTRNAPLRATDANIGIVGHITQEELNRCLSETQKANGFGNRFLYFLVGRSKVLPDGATPPNELMAKLGKDLKAAVQFARKAGRLRRDDEARELWHAKYESLSEGRRGMLGAILSRAEVQVLRLSLIYALLDRSSIVKRTHLEAALAVWDFCERSAQIIFGDSTGDEIADRIFEFLRGRPQTETQISNHLGRHVNSDRIKSALAKLEALQRVKSSRTKTSGRPKTVWIRLAQKAKKAN